MSNLTESDVRRVADLARLELTADEVELFTVQLARILDYVEQIRGLDTSGVEATSHAIDQSVERDDVLRPGLPRSEALRNAPEAANEAGLFKVPRVFG